MWSTIFFLLGYLSLGTQATFNRVTYNHTTSKCHNLTIPLTLTSTVRQFPSNFDSTTFNLSTVPNLPATNISGKYAIAATYCQPDVDYASNVLYILIHGAYYTRTYWSGLRVPPRSINHTEYSFIDYAASKGIPTLAIDRLCNGASSHPNNTQACQVENQVAVLKTLVEKAQKGDFGGRQFPAVSLIAHSFGSIVTQALMILHPGLVSEVVLTGFSTIVLQGAEEIARRGALNAPSTYLSMTNETLFENAFFYGSYSKALAECNYKISGTFNIWEALTTAFGQSPAGEYTGRVIVMNGRNDGAVCRGDCLEGKPSLIKQVLKLYPLAGFVHGNLAADTGHCLNLHYTAKQSFKAIFDNLFNYN